MVYIYIYDINQDNLVRRIRRRIGRYGRVKYINNFMLQSMSKNIKMLSVLIIWNHSTKVMDIKLANDNESDNVTEVDVEGMQVRVILIQNIIIISFQAIPKK